MTTAAQKNLENLRLKGVATVSFIRSEATNLELYKKQPHYPGDLKDGEAFLFLSKSGNQLVFLFRPPILFEKKDENTGEVIKTLQVVDSRRWRLPSGSTWHPYMLQNYANEVGIHLVGIKRFETIYAEMLQKKKEKRK